MSNVNHHQNPNFKPPHILSTKHDVLIKNKPPKKSLRSNKNKINKNNNNFTNPKPLKVVHISNPMKYEASPTEFRSLVQELTGRDADVSYWFDDDYHRVNHHGSVAGGGGSGGDGDGCSDGGVTTDDQVVQVIEDDSGNNNNINNNIININNYGDEVYSGDVTSFSGACFGPSDHIGYDYFVPLHHGDIDDDFRALMADHLCYNGK